MENKLQFGVVPHPPVRTFTIYFKGLNMMLSFPMDIGFLANKIKKYSWKTEWWYSKVTNFTVKLIMKVDGDGKVC